MLNGFTQQALTAVIFAQEEARRSGFRTIGCGHLLLGLIRLGSGSTIHVLRANGVSLALCRANVDAVTGKGTDFPELDRPWYQKLFSIETIDKLESDFNEEAKTAMRRSSEVAQGKSSDGISARDLLLGILETPNNSALAALIRSGKDPAKIKEDLISTADTVESAPASMRMGRGATPDEAIAACMAAQPITDQAGAAESKQKLKRFGKLLLTYNLAYSTALALVIYFVFPHLPGIVISGTARDAILLVLMMYFCGCVMTFFASLIIALGVFTPWRSKLQELTDSLGYMRSQLWPNAMARFFIALLVFIVVSMFAPSMLQISSWYGLIIAAIIVVTVDLVIGFPIKQLFDDRAKN